MPLDPLEFTDALRRVLTDARHEAARLQHEHVGTEHLLLALLREADRPGDGAVDRARVVLDGLGVDRAQMQRVIEDTALRGRAPSVRDQIAYTSRARAVLELAVAEARILDQEQVGTEHLLLGLAHEERGIAAQVLLDFGVTLDKARGEVGRLE